MAFNRVTTMVWLINDNCKEKIGIFNSLTSVRIVVQPFMKQINHILCHIATRIIFLVEIRTAVDRCKVYQNAVKYF